MVLPCKEYFIVKPFLLDFREIVQVPNIFYEITEVNSLTELFSSALLNATIWYHIETSLYASI